MASEWISHVKAFSKKNKISYKEAMSKAKASYKPKGAKKDDKKEKKKPAEKKEKKMTKKDKKKMEEEEM